MAGLSPQDVGIKTWGTRRANGCKAPKSAPALDSQEQQRLAETRIQPPEVSLRAHAASAKELPTVSQHEHVRSGAGSVDTEGSLSTDAPLELSRTLSGTRRRIKVRKRSWQRSGEKATAEADDSTRAQDSPGALKDAAASLLREELEELRAAKHVLRARASKLEDRAAMLEDAGAQLRAELDELRQGHRNRRHHRSHGNDNDKDVASITMTVGEADIANLYAYCIETILRTSSLLSVGVHIFGLFALLTLQITCVTQPDERGAVLAGALTFVLPVFACRAGADAWGFYNASLVLHMLGYFPAYKDPVPTHFMYPTTTLELRHGINGDLTPLINLIVSITSLAVLALFMKNDDESTLLSTSPLEVVLLPATTPDETKGAAKSNRIITSWLFRGVLCCLLQVFTAARTLMLPVLAGLGTAFAFSGATDAQDIVLNSVAIAFVFELDDVLYSMVLSKKRKEAFEEHPPPPTSALTSSAGMRIASNYAWCLYVVDVTAMCWFYVVSISSNTDLAFVYAMIRNWCCCRCGTFAAAEVHLALYSGRLESGARKVSFFVGLVALPLCMLAVGLAVFTVVMAEFDMNLGPSLASFFNEDVAGCFCMEKDDSECAALGQQSDILRELKRQTAYMYTKEGGYMRIWTTDFSEPAPMDLSENVCAFARYKALMDELASASNGNADEPSSGYNL